VGVHDGVGDIGRLENDAVRSAGGVTEITNSEKRIVRHCK
jgi:hypothetical protein